MSEIEPEIIAVQNKGTKKEEFTNIEPVECKCLLYARNSQAVTLSPSCHFTDSAYF